MIKGDKRSFRPKVGAICKINNNTEYKYQVLGYTTNSTLIVRKTSFDKGGPGHINYVISTYMNGKHLYDESLQRLPNSDEIKDSIRDHTLVHMLVTISNVVYVHSGKETSLKFKLPKL